MKICTLEDANKINLGDALLSSIEWRDDKNLIIKMLLADDKIGTLKFFWYYHLRIDLDYEDYTTAMTWDVIFSKKDNNTWHTIFDFGGTPKGFIELDSNEIDYIEEERG